MSSKLRLEIESFLRDFGVFKTGFANPDHGFEHAHEGCRPHDLMPSCRTVVSYAFPVGLDYYVEMGYTYSEKDARILNIYRDWISFELAEFLKNKGYTAATVPRQLKNPEHKIAPLSFKLAAYEAGVGVYGRPSFIVTPEYGPRVNLGAVLTDAPLQPDKRLDNFMPCQHCAACAEICPVRAIDKRKPPPMGFNRTLCLRFIDWLRKNTNDEIRLCGLCYNNCPLGKKVEKTLRVKRWKTLNDLDREHRAQLASRFEG